MVGRKDKTHIGSTWTTTAKNRFIKQHGSIDEIPEGDAHAIPKYEPPISVSKTSPQELESATAALENKIKELKAQNTDPITTTH